jgi:hypothetical protein
MKKLSGVVFLSAFVGALQLSAMTCDAAVGGNQNPIQLKSHFSQKIAQSLLQNKYPGPQAPAGDYTNIFSGKLQKRSELIGNATVAVTFSQPERGWGEGPNYHNGFSLQVMSTERQRFDRHDDFGRTFNFDINQYDSLVMDGNGNYVFTFSETHLSHIPVSLRTLVLTISKRNELLSVSIISRYTRLGPQQVLTIGGLSQEISWTERPQK